MSSMTTQAKASVDELSATLQQRADYIPLEDLLSETASTGSLFSTINSELTNRALRTIVGPRGCGKTHMMRVAWLNCRDNASKPYAVFSSFQRYFRLEPLLSSNAGAAQLFHSWVLARVLISAHESSQAWTPAISDADKVFEEQGYPPTKLHALATRLERNQPLDDVLNAFSDSLSIDRTKGVIDKLREAAERKYTVLLLDDAAMTLTPDYLIEFLDIVRSLKSATIAPKVSVYPGTTEASPRFHQGQDATAIPAWISVESPEYDAIMGDIASVRVKDLEVIPDDVTALLRFAAFGIPRAYLTMLEDYQRGGFKTAHQGVNRIIAAHLTSRLAEFRTLGKKIPKLEILVAAGETFVSNVAKELKDYNVQLLGRGEKGLAYGIRVDELVPLLERTLNLLIEAGLIYNDGDVKHGGDRIYRKYIPHTTLLLSNGTFTGHKGSLKENLDGIRNKSTKHPLRKSLDSVVGEHFVAGLNLALPKCANCSERRLTDNQRFCHNCAHQLVDASTFNLCLDTSIAEVPGLTGWQRTQIQDHLPFFKTIRDYLAKQDPAAELLTVAGFGKSRTARIIDVLNSFVDDYLS